MVRIRLNFSFLKRNIPNDKSIIEISFLFQVQANNVCFLIVGDKSKETSASAIQASQCRRTLNWQWVVYTRAREKRRRFHLNILLNNRVKDVSRGVYIKRYFGRTSLCAGRDTLSNHKVLMFCKFDSSHLSVPKSSLRYNFPVLSPR